MKSIKKIIVFLGCLATLFSIGCKKFVGVDPPATLLTTTNVFNDNSTATAALLGIYSQIVETSSYPYVIEKITALSSDEFKCYSTDLLTLAYYNNNLDAANTPPDIWATGYKYIYQENAIIEGLANNTKLTISVNQQLTGEAKFIRAWWYFALTNFYGDVPLILTTDYKTNSNLPRTSKAKIMAQVINDLIDAQKLLNASYVDATSTPSASAERVRPNKAAAAALLARAYLYIKDYVNAEAVATTVINNSSYRLPGVDTVFKKNSPEAIWQLSTSPNNGYTYEGAYFILTGAPEAGGVRSSTISDSLFNAFEANDLRKSKWLNKITVGNNSYYYPWKYQLGSKAVAPSTEYSIVLRLAEQYLIRAESRAQLNESNAIDDLNTVRRRAGLTNYTGLSRIALLNAILRERRIELFTEGHRWFDLQRSGKLDELMQIVTPQKGGNAWAPYRAFFPIPTTEIQNAINLTQNVGY